MNKNSSLKNTPIAVIGLSAMFADARNIEDFWENIIQSKDSITDVPDDRWAIDDYYDADITAPDKTYCKRGGFLPDIDFNPMEFGLPPNILEVTDASQLLGLIAARDAFEDAGYGKGSEKFTKELKEKTGVLLGVGGGQKLISPLMSRLQYPVWEKALRASGVAEEDIPHIVEKMKKAYVGWKEDSFPGLLGNVISGRITNRFDLGGINSVVDAACAASLSAIKMALSELIEGRCDMMLTGGVDTDNSPFMYMSFSKTPAFSKSGNISPFSEKADGMIIGEGLGMMVLKRLEDAERDGDRIYAVIKGVGTSSDGRFKSVYAPRPSGQALAMNRAYQDAGYPASSVDLIEAHGTGTAAGDPTEFTSMQMVFGADNPVKQQIALGSVKSQIGHTKAAAGAAGMVKVALSLHHKVLPATLNVEKPNPKFDIENSSIYINTETRPWFRKDHPRRAGVSAFGFGGINVHITLEEYEGHKATNYRLHKPYKTILLHAANSAQLIQICKEELDILQNTDGEVAFNKLTKALVKDIPHPSDARLGFVATNQKECIEFLHLAIQSLKKSNKEWEHPKGIYYRPAGVDMGSNKIVALFAGQGSQYVGMGKELANAFPDVAQTFERSDELFLQKDEEPLTGVTYPRPSFTNEERKIQQKTLTQTQYAQPAIGALSMGQYKILQKAGFQPQFTAGHSFGELTALWAAGVLDDSSFSALAKTRGAAMATSSPQADAGAMLAVKASKEHIEKEITGLKGVSIANVNSRNQVVLGGSTKAIKTAEDQLKKKGFSVVALPVSAAFHTDFVKHAQLPFSSFLASQKLQSPKIPVYSNTTGQAYPKDVETLKSILNKQILNPVLFKDEIENIYNDGGRIFIEFGPKDILTNLVRNILDGKDYHAIALNPNVKLDSDLQFRQAILRMRIMGISLANIDPYKREMPTPAERTKMNVLLSGSNYVSPATQKAYQDALNNGFQIAGGQEKVVEKIVEVEKIIEVAVGNTENLQNENQEEMMNKEILQLLQTTLDSFKSNQNKSLEIFERFLSEQNQQSQQLIQLLASQINGQKEEVVTRKEKNYTQPVQPATQVVPEKLVKSEENRIEPVVKQVAASDLQEKPKKEVPIEKTAGVNSQTLEKMLMDVVSEKTGYPAEMLELNMDMEADLGIDSIKRVEIFGALTQQYPEMGDVNPNDLTELRTLAEIVNHVSQSGAVAASALATTSASATGTGTETAEVTSSVKETKDSKQYSNDHLEKALLEVVSEKTGYPAEMLELNMDMEADLGIDSIKRVEIFGALTQQYPEMADVNPNDLTELRTLAEIVSHVSQNGNVSESTPAAVAETDAENATATTNETAPPPVKETNDSNQTSLDQLEKALLEVVSEKTGYPSEMLEMNMDMEADLGIDSIKRVEIFGALTQQYPDMADINPNDLTELRTLNEIVGHVVSAKKKKSPGSLAPPEADPAESPVVKTADFHGVTRNEIDLKFLPEPDYLEFTIPDSHHILVTNDGSDLTTHLIEKLSKEGNNIVVMNLPNRDNPISRNAVTLAAHTDEAVQESMELIHSKYGKTGSFIHIHPHFEFQNGYFTQHFAEEREIIKSVFFLAKHLQKDLNELGTEQPAKFLTVTRLDGIMGHGNRGNISVVGGGIPGLVKSLNLEWSPVFCRAIDIQPELPFQYMADHIIAEFHDPNAMHVEVGISEEGRKTTQTTLVDTPIDQAIETTVSNKSVFLVSGGAKGVTATCVIEMAKAFQCKFILVGRSSAEFEIPDHAENGVDDGTLKRNIMNDLKEQGEKPSLSEVQHVFNEIVAKKEIDSTLEQILEYGGQAVYLQGDTTNLSELKPELDKITSQFGPITGIVHGAGRLADKYIQDKTEADFDNVLSVKLDGLLSLLRVVDFNTLDHLFLFSSVAGFYGNIGQTDYAIANEILSRAAHLFKTNHPNTHVSAINWGAWDSGMVSGELKAQFEAAGVKLVNSEGGSAMMVDAFNTKYANQAQVIIGDTLPAAVSHIGELITHTIHRRLKLEDNPFLKHHVIQGHAVLPVVNAVGWMAQVAESLYPDFKVFKVEDTKLFKGIVFDGTEKEKYTLELKEIEKNAEQITFEATVLSAGQKLPTNHYKARVRLIHKNSIPEAPQFSHKISGTYSAIPGENLYKDGSLFHDTYFQGIDQIIDCSEEQIVLSCIAPSVPVSEQGQFPIQSVNTFFADIQYQGMVVWVQMYKNGAKSLPLKTDSAVIYKPIPAGEKLFVNVAIEESSEFMMIAKCTVYDAEGSVYMETKGATVTVSKELVW